MTALIATIAACGSSAEGGLWSDGEDGAGGDVQTGNRGGGIGASGVEVHIRMRSSAQAWDHQDGLAGQTPTAYFSGVRKLQLFKDAADESPLTVFDFGHDFVEVSYADGADTHIYTGDRATLPNGRYTLARVVHSHVRYEVQSVMHATGYSLPGVFENVQVLSDDTIVDGKSRDHGYYNYVFSSGDKHFPKTGHDAPVPQWSETGGFQTKLEVGEWSYYFPIDLILESDLKEDLDVVLSVNMHDCYRWLDQNEPGFMSDIFDTTPTSFEPVKRFGANSYRLTIE